jgi:acetylornithine deacetylase
MSDALYTRSLSYLERLIAFDTTSRVSNLALIEFVEAELRPLGAILQRAPNDAGDKTNLLATLGPNIEGGVVLSGHTDVVPVDGQAWTSDPFTLTRRGDRLYGRGACDMKGFLALAMAAAPDFAGADVKRPVHFAFTYDEEIGCVGAPRLIDLICRSVPAPSAVIVGEPTNMQAVGGHKGISTYRVTVTGREAHSSLTHLGVSAVMAAVRLMEKLRVMAAALERAADPASPFEPKGASLTIGQVHGGTAVNILARECVFIFDLRCPPGLDPQALLQPFMDEVRTVDAEMKSFAPETGVLVQSRSFTPSFAPEAGGAADHLARRLAGDNGPARVVAYAAEAGLFQGAGLSTVICGPGSIEQAHQPDEYVEVDQMVRGAAFMERLAAYLTEG